MEYNIVLQILFWYYFENEPKVEKNSVTWLEGDQTYILQTPIMHTIRLTYGMLFRRLPASEATK